MAKRSKVLWIGGGVIGLCLLTCVGGPAVLWVLGGGTPNVSVDYVAKLNERAAAVPEEDRAWPVYLEAARLLPSRGRDPEETELIGSVRQGDDQWAEVRTIVENRREGAAVLRRAAGMPGLGYLAGEREPVDLYEAMGEEWDPPTPHAGGNQNLLINVLLPHLSPFRSFSRFLKADALVAAEDGDGRRVVENIEAMFGIARHASEHDLLINQLVGMAIRALATTAVVEVVEGWPGALSDADLARLDEVIARQDGGGPYRLSLQGERYFFYDIVQRVFTDDGAGDGHLCGAGLLALTAVDMTGQTIAPAGPAARFTAGTARLVSSSRAETVAFYDGLLDESVAWAALPAWERGPLKSEDWESFDDALDFPPDAGKKMISMLAPALSRPHQAASTLDSTEDAARVVIAMERFRIANGVWPSGLDDLVPGFLVAVPRDMFTGERLRYSVLDTGPVLYSVGTDRDDDGGRPAYRTSRWFTPEDALRMTESDPDLYDGDWVFFPVPPEEE